MPKVSVLLPVYNGEDYLRESISSILSQNFTDFELLIVDDCSTDGTWGILQQFSAQDGRITLIHNDVNLGLIKTLNKGLAAARGEYVARQDADDISLPGRLASQVKVLDEQPDCAMVSCNLQVITDSQKRPIEIMRRACDPALVAWYLLFHNHIGGHSQVMYRKETILSLGGYSEIYPHIEDYELWCRLTRSGQKIVILPQIFLSYRRHNQSISAQKSHEQEVRLYEQVRDNLKALTAQELPLEDIKYLVGFWKGKRNTIWDSWHHRFPPAHKAPMVHQYMLALSHQFAERYRQVYPETNLSQLVHRAIGQQFLYWLQSPLTTRHSLFSKFQITPYALRWHLPGVPLSWLTWLLRYPIDSAISVAYKVQNNPISQRLQALKNT